MFARKVLASWTLKTIFIYIYLDIEWDLSVPAVSMTLKNGETNVDIYYLYPRKCDELSTLNQIVQLILHAKFGFQICLLNFSLGF